MKNLRFIYIGLVLIIMSSCSSNDKESNHLAPLNVEIPEELTNNQEAVKFIEGSEMVINHWSDTLEELLQESEEYVGKEESDLSMMDKMKLAQIGIGFMSKMAEFGSEMSQLEITANTIENGLSDEELQAFEVARQAFKNRIEELGEKYENYGKRD